MKFYAKEKLFSIRDRFRFFDEDDSDLYFVESKILSLGKKLTVLDPSGNTIANINEKFLTFLPKFDILVNDTYVASVKKHLSFLKPRYSLEGPGWSIDGDFLEHNYTISYMDTVIATIMKKWMTWGDSYEIEVTDPKDALFAACVVVCIDCVNEATAAASASAANSMSSSN